ncbi:MAG: ABC transporter ATP-binding protein [Gammaproteobacteria bacterium]|nr:ABC transporter ATP-binding protein [Gammaproteobacteria bacterium]MDH3465855.1 ABC transporter ATP-binding protein [Gammaproteobacteria bacterium]
MGETLIKVEGLSKKYCRSLKKSMWYGMRDVGSELLGRRHGADGSLRPDEFWAVKDVNFELKRGECLGLIGQNGAGKTTLLRMLNGLIKPDQGRIEMRGKVGALIALGAGFNPILTGRENIYVNAAVLGMSKQLVDRKIDEIIDFAEIRDFINSPVQTYSSGMSVRLGFAIAAILIEPDILFLDEVLAVGDIGFAIKCLNTVRGMTNKSAVIFVSHNMQQISGFCSRVIMMAHGMVSIDSSNTSEGIDRYYDLVKHAEQISGTGEAEVLSLTLTSHGKIIETEDSAIDTSAELTVLLGLRIHDSITGANLVIVIRNDAEMPIRTFPVCNSEGEDIVYSAGEYLVEIPLGPIELNSGRYAFVVAISDVSSGVILTRVQGLHQFRVVSEYNYWSPGVSPRVSRLISINDNT